MSGSSGGRGQETSNPKGIQDSAYVSLLYSAPEIQHAYGQNVHILSDPFLLTHLAHLCSPKTTQPVINQLVEAIYSNLIKVVLNQEFPRKSVEMATRMEKLHPDRAFYRGEILDQDQAVVSVNLARAGTYPSHICYSALNYVLNSQVVRQDHISVNRETNAQEQVIGARVAGIKIGGNIDDAIVLFPDPMGATGNTIISAMNIYKNDIQGVAKKFIALHLIVTPEYLKRVSTAHPDVVIYAVRLDRGLSSPEVLNSVPGSRWADEKGLNDHHYIVPGGGGFGEILNNALK